MDGRRTYYEVLGIERTASLPQVERAYRFCLEMYGQGALATYSLLEPLQTAGVTVGNIDGLTGLAEYRNGGLLIDTGVLALRDPAEVGRAHAVGSPGRKRSLC